MDNEDNISYTSSSDDDGLIDRDDDNEPIYTYIANKDNKKATEIILHNNGVFDEGWMTMALIHQNLDFIKIIINLHPDEVYNLFSDRNLIQFINDENLKIKVQRILKELYKVIKKKLENMYIVAVEEQKTAIVQFLDPIVKEKGHNIT